MSAATKPASVAEQLATIGAERDKTVRAVAVARGQLVNGCRVFRHELPRRLGFALDRLERAEDDAGATAAEYDRLLKLSQADRGPAALEDSKRAARVSALVAAHVMGARLILSPEQSVFRWRVVDEHGKRRQVPNYAGDPSAIAQALERVPAGNRETFVYCLAPVLDESGAVVPSDGNGQRAAALVFASSLHRALALLSMFGVDPADEPPAIAE